MIWFAVFGGHYADGILDCDMVDSAALEKRLEESGSLCHVLPPLQVFAVFLLPADVKVLNATVAEVCAGRVRDHQIPRGRIHDLQCVFLEVIFASIFCRFKVTRPSLMAQRPESATHNAAGFAGD